MATIFSNAAPGVALMPSLNASVKFGSSSVFNKKKPTEVTIKETNNKEYSPWGSNNLWPQDLTKKIEKNDLISPLIERKVEKMYSGGVAYGVANIVDNKKQMVRLMLPEIEDFLECINYQSYFLEAGHDDKLYANFYPELVLNDERKIIDISCIDANFCRLSKQNTKGLIEYCYIQDWANEKDISTAQKVKALNPRFDVLGQIKNGKDFKYILPSRQLKRGRVVYDKPAHYGIFESGWFDIAQAIPEFKAALMKAQISIKYHVTISDDYWTQMYPGFVDYEASKKQEIMQAEVAAFETFCNENLGGSWVTGGKRFNDKVSSYWTITPIKGDDYSNGVYLADSQEADLHIARAFQTNIDTIGNNKSNGLGSSGTNQRVSFNQESILSYSTEAKINRVLYIAAQANGWNEKYGKLSFWMDKEAITTLDTGNEIETSTPNI